MSVGLRSAIPTMPARQPAFRARRDQLVTRLATCITVLTAAIAVLIVAAAAVAFTWPNLEEERTPWSRKSQLGRSLSVTPALPGISSKSGGFPCWNRRMNTCWRSVGASTATAMRRTSS
jgi:hypothetical protein